VAISKAGGELPSVAHRQRMLVTKLAEEPNGQGDQPLALFTLRSHDRFE
jgi:hypothetical protein